MSSKKIRTMPAMAAEAAAELSGAGLSRWIRSGPRQSGAYMCVTLLPLTSPMVSLRPMRLRMCYSLILKAFAGNTSDGLSSGGPSAPPPARCRWRRVHGIPCLEHLLATVRRRRARVPGRTAVDPPPREGDVSHSTQPCPAAASERRRTRGLRRRSRRRRTLHLAALPPGAMRDGSACPR